MNLIWTDPFRSRNGLTQKDFFNPGLKFKQGACATITKMDFLSAKSLHSFDNENTKQGELPQWDFYIEQPLTK